MRKHEARYVAAMQRINPAKIAAAIVRTRKNDAGQIEQYKLTDLDAVKHVLGIRLSDIRHDAAIKKVLS